MLHRAILAVLIPNHVHPLSVPTLLASIITLSTFNRKRPQKNLRLSLGKLRHAIITRIHHVILHGVIDRRLPFGLCTRVALPITCPLNTHAGFGSIQNFIVEIPIAAC